jgi:hypothetical protein
VDQLQQAAAGLILLAFGESAGPDGFELQELFQFTNAQPMHEGPDAGSFMAELRRAGRY